MPTATPQDLTYTADFVYPPGAAIGYLILLSGDLLLGEPGAIDPATDTIITTSAHGLAVGSRIRFGGVLPIDLLGTQDYFAVPTGVDTFQAARNLADAQALPPVVIDLTIASALLVNEQLLVASDPINVLINKELPAANGYQRLLIDNLAPAAVTSPTTADHPIVNLAITAGSSEMLHRYEVVSIGGTSTVGDVTGITALNVLTYPVDLSTAPAQTRIFEITLGAVAPS
jgi:hypothetical protein